MALESPTKNIQTYDGFRYKHVRSENIEELINYLGYGWLKRRKLRRSSTVFLQKHSFLYNEYELIEMTNLWQNAYKSVFTPGREPCCKSYSFKNGWQSKRYFFEGNKLVKVQQGRKKIVTIWDFSDDAVVMTVKVDDLVAKKFYERTHDKTSGCYAWCEKWCIS